jgi:hypothetical protein
MFSGRITIGMASLLFLSQLQCMFQCAVEGCPSTLISNTQNVPPCHRHQSDSGTQKSAPCERQIVASAAILPDAPQVGVTAGSPATFSLSFTSQDFGNTQVQRAAQPPEENGLRSVILRI